MKNETYFSQDRSQFYSHFSYKILTTKVIFTKTKKHLTGENDYDTLAELLVLTGSSKKTLQLFTHFI